MVEKDGSRVRVQYIGYDDSTDEWRDLSELVTIPDKLQSDKKCDSGLSNPILHDIPIH